MQRTPLLMGIVNVTPDSFYDGGLYATHEAAIDHGRKLASDGADLLDIGGESTRPSADPVAEKEELARTIPVIKSLSAELQIPLSIDTSKVEVARQALQTGASWINDVTGFEKEEMRALAAESGATAVVMHMSGSPKTMQLSPNYPNGVVATLLEWFEKRVELLLRSGVKASQIVLDPGIGFGKSFEDNLEIFRNLHIFKSLGFPLMIGASRKSFLKKIVQKPTTELLSATLAVHTIAMAAQVAIIRVHDVAAHRDVFDVYLTLAT